MCCLTSNTEPMNEKATGLDGLMIFRITKRFTRDIEDEYLT